jgi:purine-binding chemotaxis protein CheW
MKSTESKESNHPTLDAAVIRAAVLADDERQYLTFMLGEEMFAIGILSIREIIEYGFVTAVPMTPPFIRGVINLRGAVVPVIDLALRFGRKASGSTKRTCIVIVEIESSKGNHDIGVVVDAVNEVLEIPSHEIEPPPEFGARVRSDFIKGMGKINGKFVILLDVNNVLSLDEVAVLANIGQLDVPLEPA